MSNISNTSNISYYNNVWIFGEQEDGILKEVSFELLARGRALADKLGTTLSAVVFGNNIKQSELDRLFHYGADSVIAAVDPSLERFLPEPYTQVLLSLIQTYSPQIIIASATTTGRSIMPAAAVKCPTGLTADCTELDIEPETGNLIQTRPAIGGNILATIKTPSHRPQMATVRPHSNRPDAPDTSRKGKTVTINPDKSLLKSRVKFIELLPEAEENANIQDAQIIVAGGRGCKKADNFKLVRELASVLGGSVGASRDAVDLGWATYPHQVGLSGKTVAPKLYVAAGISGSIQHLAGMKTAERIVAINSDPEAQIFKVADIGIVGNLAEILPMLTKKIKDLQPDLKGA